MMQIPLNLIVIKVLSKRELSGYELMNKIKEETGYWKPSPGTIYPLLEKLEKKGLLRSKAEGKKKIYRLTQKASLFMKIAETKKAFMAKHALCCLNVYKFLFGDDIVVPVIEADESFRFLTENEMEKNIRKEFPEIKALEKEIILASENRNPKKIKIIRNAINEARLRIKNK